MTKDALHPLVSVIVPVHNVERYLDCCLDSIRAQSYERLEIIVVEDCSTDDSLAKLERHLIDPRVRLLRHECNSGLSAARNTGIDAAKGIFVLFVDSDDAIAPNLIEACIVCVHETRADLVVFDFAAFTDGADLPETGQALHTVGSSSLGRVDYLRLPHFAWLKFIRAELLRDPRLRFPVGLCYEDWPFHWELGFSSTSIRQLSGHWYSYRQRGTSITASLGRKLLDQFTVQHSALETVRQRGGTAEAKVLAAKVHVTYWAVLTRIDASLLAEAIGQAQALQSELRLLGAKPPRDARAILMAALLSLPRGLVSVGVRLLRGAKSLTTLTNRPILRTRSTEMS